MMELAAKPGQVAELHGGSRAHEGMLGSRGGRALRACSTGCGGQAQPPTQLRYESVSAGKPSLQITLNCSHMVYQLSVYCDARQQKALRAAEL